ncbi:exosortase A [Novosphingobium sp.]|uniref:exosortase A n=1 Tax=Novosphingobium sp. TaxID=1874826 RepID=UPI0031D7965B
MPREPFSPDWGKGLTLLALLWGIMIGAAGQEWRAMADQWWNISTYTHVLLIPLILGWQVWHRWSEAKQLRPACWWPGLILLLLAALVWVAGRLANLAELAQFGAVGMLVAAVPLMLGTRVTAAFLFPLAYMVFLVPFGDEIIPPLQTITARLCIWLVVMTHVPAHIDGVFIATPAGLFEVAEACSGVKFLVAMLAFGALAANVCFRSWKRRIAFMALCVVVPVLANGVRAWGTIYVAQIKGAAYAGGVDHIIYGWFFFAAVIAAILAIGWPFFDRKVRDPMIDGAAIARSPVLARLDGWRCARGLAGGGAFAIVLACLVWSTAAARLEAPMPPRIEVPQVPGWHRVGTPLMVDWTPRAAGADHRIQLRYADDKGRIVDMFYALYAAQGPGRKATGFGEGALPPGSSWQWQGPGAGALAAQGDRLLAHGHIARLAQTTWHTGDTSTGSSVTLRLANLQDRLMLRRVPTMMLILSVEEEAAVAQQPGGDPAIDTLHDFRRAIGPVGSFMDHIALGTSDDDDDDGGN